jgi:hypothetical protein
MATDTEVMQVATSPRTVNEVTYFRGLKALADGRFEESFWWYQASIETGELQSGEYRWAFNQLRNWTSSDDSTKVLSERYAKAAAMR